MITRQLFDIIYKQYAQSSNGTHGVSHWARVLENGRLLTEKTGANLKVVELFAVFHDSKRISEKRDPGHGLRGAEYAASLRGKAYQLSDTDFDLLYYACAHHTDGETEADITVQVCWDSDRLDLGRAFITPVPEKLCTAPAKDLALIDWAHKRSCSRFVPELVLNEWGVNVTTLNI